MSAGKAHNYLLYTIEIGHKKPEVLTWSRTRDTTVVSKLLYMSKPENANFTCCCWGQSDEGNQGEYIPSHDIRVFGLIRGL